MKRFKISILLSSISLFCTYRAIAQNVNQFNGQFSYSVPLITVPSPYGPGVNLTANYVSGVLVNQNASEIGLGWDINLGGSITRTVNGIPDEWLDVSIPDPQLGGFKTQTGVLNFNSDTPSDNMDFYTSTYKIDTLSFYFPNYDNYSVSGPGIGGSLKPRLLDFATTELNAARSNSSGPLHPIPYTVDAVHGFDKSPQFYFEGDYHGDYKTRHYSTTPITNATDLNLPGTSVTDSELGSSPEPYVGVNSIGYDQLNNRLATAKYVESGFKITDENGFVYTYDLAVYVNSITYGNYPLNNDYSVRALDTTRVIDGDNYYIKENTLADNSISYDILPKFVEWKQAAPYVYKWLLTSVVGPDYENTNSNSLVDNGDKGYWVTYDWKLWSSHFTKRIPEYGFDYSFTPDVNTEDKGINDITKISGLFGKFSKYDQEVYYLNKIQTSSHTAIMVRDVRLDECSSQPYIYDNQLQYTSSMPAAGGSATKTTSYGTLYDDGGSTGNYTNSCSSKVTITPPGASSITIRFNYLNITDSTNDFIKVLDPSNGDAVLATYSGILPTGPVTFNKSSIKIQEFTNGNVVSGGFRLGWSSSVHPAVMPQLKLTKIVLFRNEDFSTLNNTSSAAYNVSTSQAGFTLANVNVQNFYNETWYNHIDNKISIESKSLQTIEFNQDYSLARKCHSNIKTLVTASDKLSNPSEVQAGVVVASADYSSSGKLSLNEIKSFDLAHVKTSPSNIFDYNATISTDNPNYNPVKTDYWGYYKSDASPKGYSGYTNSLSKDSTDAWSLRKITTSLGSIMEMVYESNQYSKVLDGTGGFRGPSKMYRIKTATENASDAQNWTYTMEEGTYISDFDSLKTYHPSGTHVFIPSYSPTYDMKFISSGTFTFGSSSTAQGISNVYFTDSPFNLNSTYSSGTTSGVSDYIYTGNGYIHFDLPIGIAQYGGGIRLKTLTTRNGTTDAYVQEYVYSDGVTPMEPDRFAEEKLSRAIYSSQGSAHYLKLRSVAYDMHRMGPAIGYTKVSTKNLGQINTASITTTYKFITSDANIDNYKANIVVKTGASFEGSGFGGCENTGLIDSSYIIEVVDKFAGYWGQVKEVQKVDINGNIISKTINEFSNLTQGAIVENYDFLNKKKNTFSSGGESATCYQRDHIICIKREFPSVLTKVNVYEPGKTAMTEFLAFDKITGIPTSSRLSNPNNSIRVTRKCPAFRISQYSAMGPKSVSSTNKNILSQIAYTRTTVDSTITGNSDFISYSIQTFKKDLNSRYYDATTGRFISAVKTNKYWIADKSYEWAGANTSLDNYGLFKNSESPTFDYTLSSVDSKWRFGAENTLVDESGHAIELRGFNDRFSAKKYGYGDTLQIATASNVNYPSFTVCGFEAKVTDLDPGAGVVNYMEGEVKLNNGSKINGDELFPPHTGNYMMSVGGSSTSGPEYSVKYNNSSENSGLLKNRTYRASVWVHSSSPSDCKISLSYTGLSTQASDKSSATITVGDWSQMIVEITVPSSPSNNDELKMYLTGGTTGVSYFDDLRLQPVESNVTATVYDSRTNRVMATLDGNNFATIYKYDAGGRVIEIWQEIDGVGLKRLKKFQYNFARGLN
jgi:hypothetical protein